MQASPFSRFVACRVACVVVAAAITACRAGDAELETSTGSVEEVDRTTVRLSVGTLTAANGTYGAGCTARSGSWSAGISGSGSLTNAPLSVVQDDVGCVLTLTELVASATYSVTPPIVLSGAYHGSASAVGTGASKFYANAKLSAVTLAADFVVTLLYSEDPGAATGSLTAGFATSPTATLVTPADVASVGATPTLTATFSDSDPGDTGQLDFRIDTTSGCDATPIQSGQSAASVASGANGSWTVGTALAAGTYYWCAQAVDARGLTSAWTATRSFVVSTSGPTVVASSTGSTGNSDTSLPIAKPAGTLAGMLMIAAIANDGSRTASLSGWTSLGHSSNSAYLDMFYRVAGASEPASYTFSMSGTARISGGIITLSGANATPIDATGAAASSATATSITTSVSNTLLVGCWANIAALSTPAAGMTEQFDVLVSSRIDVACSTEARPTAGATGTRAVTGTGSGWTSRLVSVKP